MNQGFTSKLKDSICSSCRCDEQLFLHILWHENKIQRVCTSCVLLNLNEFYCAICFAVHDQPSEDMLQCKSCKSYSHRICLAPDCGASEELSCCSSCNNPSALIFTLRELKAKGENGKYKQMDKNASALLLTAAKISTMSMRKRVKALGESIEMKVNQAIKKREDANDLVLKATGHEEGAAMDVDGN